LREFGLIYTFPEYDEAWIFPDDKYVLGKAIREVVDPMTGESEFSSENAQFNINQIKKISQHDADVAEEIIRRFQAKWRDAFGRYRYTGPEEWGDGKDPLEELMDDPKDGIDPKYATMTVGEIAVDMFESPEMQTFYMRAMQTSNGLMPEDVPGIYWHIHVLGLVLSVEPAAIVYGGTHSITHALLRAFQKEGGEFFVLNEVEKVLVEGGKATGIRLKDGSEIMADIVISDLTIDLTLELLGQENVPRDIWDKMQDIKEFGYEDYKNRLS